MRSLWVLVMVLALASVASETIAVDVHRTSYGGPSAGYACCRSCICAYSNPPQCRCRDVKPYCDKSCKTCVCTRSIPPQCRCDDVGTSCHPPSCRGVGFVPGLNNP